MKTKVELILTDPFYNVRLEFGRQASDLDSCIENDISEMVEMCGENLKLTGNAHRFYSAVSLSSCISNVFSLLKISFLKTQRATSENMTRLCLTEISNAWCTLEIDGIQKKTVVE